jgi:hypothetical protein
LLPDLLRVDSMVLRNSNDLQVETIEQDAGEFLDSAGKPRPPWERILAGRPYGFRAGRVGVGRSSTRIGRIGIVFEVAIVPDDLANLVVDESPFAMCIIQKTDVLEAHVATGSVVGVDLHIADEDHKLIGFVYLEAERIRRLLDRVV